LSVRALLLFLCAGLAASGCGTLGGEGGGERHRPVSGAGPFGPLQPDPSYAIDAPVVLLDPTADLDDPMVLADGELLGLWVTARRKGTTTIEHADALALEEGFGPLQLTLQADQAWEGGAVAQPAVIWSAPWLLFYAAGGGIGVASAVDGHRFTKTPGTTLVPRGAEEGGALSSPAAVRLGDRVRVYYVAAGKVFAAETDFGPLAAGQPADWTRLDGDPTTPARDPMLSPPVWAGRIERVTARAAATPAGRLRHDLYITARVLPDGPVGCGYAASYTGDRFLSADAPILPLKPGGRAPTETPYRDEALLLYVNRTGVRDAILAGVSP
jgi:hypothetical protein